MLLSVPSGAFASASTSSAAATAIASAMSANSAAFYSAFVGTLQILAAGWADQSIYTAFRDNSWFVSYSVSTKDSTPTPVPTAAPSMRPTAPTLPPVEPLSSSLSGLIPSDYAWAFWVLVVAVPVAFVYLLVRCYHQRTVARAKRVRGERIARGEVVVPLEELAPVEIMQRFVASVDRGLDHTIDLLSRLERAEEKDDADHGSGLGLDYGFLSSYNWAALVRDGGGGGTAGPGVTTAKAKALNPPPNPTRADQWGAAPHRPPGEGTSEGTDYIAWDSHALFSADTAGPGPGAGLGAAFSKGDSGSISSSSNSSAASEPWGFAGIRLYPNSRGGDGDSEGDGDTCSGSEGASAWESDGEAGGGGGGGQRAPEAQHGGFPSRPPNPPNPSTLQTQPPNPRPATAPIIAEPRKINNPFAIQAGDLLTYRRDVLDAKTGQAKQGQAEKCCVVECLRDTASGEMSFLVQFADGRLKQTLPPNLWIPPNIVRAASTMYSRPPLPTPCPDPSSLGRVSFPALPPVGEPLDAAGEGGMVVYLGREGDVARDIALHKIRSVVLAGKEAGPQHRHDPLPARAPAPAPAPGPGPGPGLAVSKKKTGGGRARRVIDDSDMFVPIV